MFSITTTRIEKDEIEDLEPAQDDNVESIYGGSVVGDTCQRALMNILYEDAVANGPSMTPKSNTPSQLH